MRLALIVLLPFFGAVLVAWLPRAARRTAACSAALIATLCIVSMATLVPAVWRGEVIRHAWPWMPALGIDFGFRMDGLALLFVMLVLGIGLLIVLYAAYYLAEEDSAPRFFAYLLAFMGAMLGIVLADNLILLVVFWELTSVTSFLLIGFWHTRADARQGARMALAVTGAGGLCLLAGVVLIGEIIGSYRLDAVLAGASTLQAHPLYGVALVLVLAGALTKSAQFPFHFWLPHAMAAPTPVSAYLHSATMVKAGVFLLARLWPALSGTEIWFWVVSTAGIATLLFGAYTAIFQQDLKGLLAYSTISHLGLITLLFGLNSPLAAVAGVFHIVNHAIFKASLFMAAGIIDHESGSRDLRKLNGLFRLMPITATLAMVASASMAGVPLLNGFLSKEMFFAETLFLEGHLLIEIATPAAATLAGVFGVAYSLRFIHDVFFNGEPVGLPRTPHEPPRWMRLPVEVLVVLCLIVGLIPAYTVGPLLAVAATPVVGGTLPEYSLAIWHGFNWALAMSMIAFAGGLVLYFLLQKRVNLHRLERVPGTLGADGKRTFDALMGASQRAGEFITTRIDNGHLQRYVGLLVVAAIVAAAVPLLANGVAALTVKADWPDLFVVIVWGVGLVGIAGTVIWHRQRLVALVFAGSVGLVVSLAFVYFSAPDLALTQLLVEVVTIILMVLALKFLPRESPAEMRSTRRVFDAAIALAAGVGMTLIAMTMLTRPINSISDYFLATSLPLGGGANVVNVIIVDYRGYDTLGEITVLGVAGLIVAALLKTLATHHGATASIGQPPSLFLALVTRLLLPMATLVAIYFYLRGHNLPGGGFIAGLTLAAAILLVYVAHGSAWTEQRWRDRYVLWIGAGLAIAGLTGVASGFVSHPFLTSTFAYPELPIVGKIPLASAALFDLGVFLTVVGATMLALTGLGRLSLPEANGSQPWNG